MGMMVKEALDIARRNLSGAGIEESKVDAELLLCYMLNLDKSGLFMIWSKNLDDDQCDRYFALVDQRSTRKPLQHITGKQAFMGMEFIARENVLIPRPETELLVEEVIKYVESTGKKCSILDLCCGSGIIGISLDKLLKGAKVTCSDLSGDAVKLTEDNAKALKSSVNVLRGDLFQPFKGRLGNKKFDIIVSNPPYIESMVIDTLEPEVAAYEPRLALDGGASGLEIYKKIAAEAGEHLKKKGALFLEIGHNQGPALKEILEGTGIFAEVEVMKDYNGFDRMVKAVL